MTDTPLTSGTRPMLSRRAALQGAAAVGILAMTKPVWAQQAAPPVVLITGTSSGFGRLMAEGFARNGARVVATMRDVTGKNAPAAAELTALGLPIDVVEIDVLDDQSVKTGVARALELAGRIDVLVSNAGIVVPGPAELQPPKYFAANIDTNMVGASRVMRAVLPAMRKQGAGTIIQMSSALGRAIDPMYGGYCASKLAVEAYCDALAYEAAASNIEVSIIQPAGPYPTKFQEKGKRLWDEMLAATDRPDPALREVYARHIELMLAEMTPDPEINPKEVSDAAIALAAMPFGSKPRRLVVGPYKDGLEPVNAAHETLQNGMMEHNDNAALYKLG